MKITAHILSRYWPKVAKRGPYDCWEWLGCKSSRLYGNLGVKPQVKSRRWKMVKAHRIGYQIAFGKLRDDQVLHHVCKNPGCVNPLHLLPMRVKDHLFIEDNLGTRNRLKTTCPQGHPLSGTNLKFDKRKDGGVARRCRICANAAVRRNWDRLTPERKLAIRIRENNRKRKQRMKNG